MSDLTFDADPQDVRPDRRARRARPRGASTGELISLLGPSGAARRPRCASPPGSRSPTAGDVSSAATTSAALPAHKRNMGMVFQSYSLFPNLTVTGNVEYGLRTRKLPKPRARTGASPRCSNSCSSASHGQPLRPPDVGRPAAARRAGPRPRDPAVGAAARRAAVSALDAKVRATLRDEIRRIQTELGITTLFVTHDQEEALAISDRIGVMSNGRHRAARPADRGLPQPVDRVRRPLRRLDERAARRRPRCRRGHRWRMRRGHTRDRPAQRRRRCALSRPPEDMSLGDGEADGMPGTVTARTFQGAATIVACASRRSRRAGVVHVSGSAAAHLTPGDRVNVVIDGSRGVCETPAAA